MPHTEVIDTYQPRDNLQGQRHMPFTGEPSRQCGDEQEMEQRDLTLIRVWQPVGKAQAACNGDGCLQLGQLHLCKTFRPCATLSF